MNNKFTALSQLLTLAQTIPVIGLGMYMAGFIALNAHLGKYGAFDMAILNAHYLIIGAHYFVFLAMWYLLPGRIIIRIDSLNEECDIPYSIDRVLYSLCISAALFSITLLGRTEPILFCVYIVVIRKFVHMWENIWETRHLYTRFPNINRLMPGPVTNIIGVVIFFLTIDFSSPTMLAFVHFLLISVYVFLVLRSLKQGEMSGEFDNPTEKSAYALTHSVLFLLLTFVLFGWLQYGHIKSVFGGGELRPVEIILVDQTVSKGLRNIGFEVVPNFKANRVYENQEELIVAVKDTTIRLNKNTIGGFQVLHSGVDTWAAYFYRMINKIKAILLRVSLNE